MVKLQRSFSIKNDICHVFNYFNFFPKIFVIAVANTTTLIELNGIKTAAIMGCNCPVTAKKSPMILYNKDMIKLNLIIFTAFFEASMY